MAEVERLLREFVSAFEEGEEPNPRTYIDQAEGVDRAELEALIDAYLERAPARAWDGEAFGRSDASQLADRLHASLVGASGLWPSLLPRLRDRAKLKRSELVSRLATELGHPGEAERVGDYYHEMESGLLPSTGVSDTVLDALAGILDSTKSTLRDAGGSFGLEGRAERVGVFARAKPPLDTDTELSVPPKPEGDWDELDKLFRASSNG